MMAHSSLVCSLRRVPLGATGVYLSCEDGYINVTESTCERSSFCPRGSVFAARSLLRPSEERSRGRTPRTEALQNETLWGATAKRSPKRPPLVVVPLEPLACHGPRSCEPDGAEPQVFDRIGRQKPPKRTPPTRISSFSWGT